MGADLTIKKTKRYFRDSYGPSNTWWAHKMSYWEISQVLQEQKMLHDGEVNAKGVAYICKRLQTHPFIAKEEFVEQWRKDRASDGETTREEVLIEQAWNEAQEAEAEMQSFWKEAAISKSDVSWSV